MKETPIIMSGNHPKLILDGIKTQTRRVIKKDIVTKNAIASIIRGGELGFTNCPYGQVGDRLWVREKALYWTGGAGGTSGVVYTDDSQIPHLLEDNNTLLMARETTNILEGEPVLGKWQWKPSIFMPRWASRIERIIILLRAERLRAISEADAKAEGGYTIEEFIKMFLHLNHLSEDANPFNWVIGW